MNKPIGRFIYMTNNTINLSFETFEEKLLSLLKGKWSHLDLSFNKITSILKCPAIDFKDSDISCYTWLSNEDKFQCIENNSMWVLHYYPYTPLEQYSVVGSSLSIIMSHLLKQSLDVSEIELLLKSKMSDDYSTLSIDYNDCFAYYKTVEDVKRSGAVQYAHGENTNWVSPIEKQLSLSKNSLWNYYSSPGANRADFYASSLTSILNHLKNL